MTQSRYAIRNNITEYNILRAKVEYYARIACSVGIALRRCKKKRDKGCECIVEMHAQVRCRTWLLRASVLMRCVTWASASVGDEKKIKAKKTRQMLRT